MRTVHVGARNGQLPANTGKMLPVNGHGGPDLGVERACLFKGTGANGRNGMPVGDQSGNEHSNQTQQTMSAKSTLAITLTALAAGAALGILLAPASGKDTRKKLMKKGSDMRDSLSDMLAEGGELIDKLKGQAKDAANTTKDRVKEAANEAAGAARPIANGGYKS